MLSALVLAGALATAAACTGGDQVEEDGGAPARVAPELPSSVDTIGPVTEPLMEPISIVRSTGTAEAGSYDLLGQGLFVDGEVAVYYALDTILAVSMEDASTVWKTPVDMGGEIVELAGTAPHGDHRWSFVYPNTQSDDPDLRGDHLVTVDVRSGEVVADEVLGSYGAAEALTSTDGEDYLATDEGVFRINDEGGLEKLLGTSDLPGPQSEVNQLVPIQDSDVLTVKTVVGGTRTTAVAGLDTASGELVWQHDVSDFATDAREAGYVDVSPGDGRYITRPEYDRHNNETLNLWVLDPESGEVRAHQAVKQRNQTADDHLMQITSEEVGPQNPYGMFPVGDDVVFEDYHGVSRYDPLEGEFLWSVRVGLMGLRNSDSRYATFGLGPTSPDGDVVYATLASAASGDLVAIDLETGDLKGRWALDDKAEAGLVSRPLMVLDGDRVLLARNRTVEGDPTLMDQEAKPLGKLNDIGLLRFPELEG